MIQKFFKNDNNIKEELKVSSKNKDDLSNEQLTFYRFKKFVHN